MTKNALIFKLTSANNEQTCQNKNALNSYRSIPRLRVWHKVIGKKLNFLDVDTSMECSYRPLEIHQKMKSSNPGVNLNSS